MLFTMPSWKQGKDRPPMLAPGNYVYWKSRIKRYIDTKPNNEHIHYCLQNPLYKFRWIEKTVLVAEGIDNDIYSIVDSCPNTCEMWKAIERLKQELKIVSYHKLYDILKQHQNEVKEIRAERLARTANPLVLVAQQQPIYHPQNHPNHYTQNSSIKSQPAATRNRGKAIVNSPPSTYDQEPIMVAEDDEMSKEKEIDKLIALISLSFKKIYKPTNNNLRTSSNTSRANQDNTPRINRGTGYDNQRVVNVAGARENGKRAKDAAYHKEKMLLCKQEEAGFQLNAEQADWRDDTDDEPKDQELEAHYMYMAQIQEVTPDAADILGPIFDVEPLQKLIEIILFIIGSGCSKHMTGNLKLLFVILDFIHQINEDFVKRLQSTYTFPFEDLKSRGSIVSFREMITSQLQGKLRLYDEVRARTLFVLSSSNRGRLLGIIDLMRQKNKRMKQEGLNRQIGILQKMEFDCKLMIGKLQDVT
ncbi:hypothetical protein Tco_1096543 [Tanacetum coccineum]